MNIVAILTILVSNMLVYAAPLIFTILEVLTLSMLVLLMLAWKASWSWELLQELFLTCFR